MKLKMYGELAEWWPLLSPPEDYAEEAEFFARTLTAYGSPPAHTLLELGSGGGNNASFLKNQFRMTLVDSSLAMLAVSHRLNPECEHVVGDMRSIRLGREFDRVFIHDAISYMTTLEELRQAIGTAYMHCRPGGAAVFVPDHVREKFHESTDHAGADGEDGRALRYLEWMWDPDPADSSYVVDYVYLLRERDRTTRVEHERHTEGLFAREDWLRVMAEAGFTGSVVPFDHSEQEPGSFGFYRGEVRGAARV